MEKHSSVPGQLWNKSRLSGSAVVAETHYWDALGIGGGCHIRIPHIQNSSHCCRYCLCESIPRWRSNTQTTAELPNRSLRPNWPSPSETEVRKTVNFLPGENDSCLLTHWRDNERPQTLGRSSIPSCPLGLRLELQQSRPALISAELFCFLSLE